MDLVDDSDDVIIDIDDSYLELKPPSRLKKQKTFSRKKKAKTKPSESDILSDDEIFDVDNGPEDKEEEEEEEEEEERNEFDDLLEECEKFSKKLKHLLDTCNIDDRRVCVDTQRSDLLIPQPEGLRRELKSYQVVGLNWLNLLHKENINGILADEMGLGKTIQTISLFQHLLESKEKGPHLIVVPSSTLRNWEREVTTWSTLSTLIYYGKQKDREDIQYEIIEHRNDYKSGQVDSEYNFDIMITTYQVSMGKVDRGFLKSIKFNYLVLDEAQNIKNKESRRYQSLYRLKSQHRLLLTGTPLQNNLDELVSLLSFLMPSLFSDVGKVKISSEIKRLRKMNLIDEERDYVEKMKLILDPFILRRLKSQVGMQIEPKKEYIINCEMTDLQRDLYETIFRNSKDLIDEQEKEAENGKKKHMNQYLSNVLMQLRKVVNHPFLIRSSYPDDSVRKIATKLHSVDDDYSSDRLEDVVQDLMLLSDFELNDIVSCRPYLRDYKLNNDQILNTSGKFKVLKRLLPKLRERGRRVIIFSQMTRVLDVLEVFLKDMHLGYLRLDGKTPVEERQNLIDEYTDNQEKYFVFLLSTLAGGVGINLVSANVVIFYDISFNPHVDRQAEDRCHRLGQEKEVEIYKLITVDSIEEHMLKMAEEKKELNDIMLNEGKYEKKFSHCNDNDEGEESKVQLVKSYMTSIST